jgi:hypothetical protein
VSRDTCLPQHARRLIERGWTQHADARAVDDSVVHPCDSRAVSWSLLGSLVAAVEHIAESEGEQAAIAQLGRTCILLADIVDTDSLERWNDASDRLCDDVIVALDHAARDAGQQDAFSGFSPN